jgi:hypothetical protein
MLAPSSITKAEASISIVQLVVWANPGWVPIDCGAANSRLADIPGAGSPIIDSSDNCTTCRSAPSRQNYLPENGARDAYHFDRNRRVFRPLNIPMPVLALFRTPVPASACVISALHETCFEEIVLIQFAKQ